VKRQVIPFKRISLTDLTVKINFNPKSKTLTAAWEKEEILSKWEASSWAKKIANKRKRASLSDFDRFKVMVAKKQKSSIIAKKMKAIAA